MQLPAQWTSPAEAAARKWLIWGAAPVAGLVILAGVWSMFFRGKPASNPVAPANPPVASAPDLPAPTPGLTLHARWIPDAPEFLLSLEVAALESSGVLATIYQTAPGVREAVADKLFQGFGLQPKAVKRVTWASANLGDWSGRGVVVVELAEGQNAGVLRSAGETLDWQIKDFPVRQLVRPAWALPYVVLDDRTIVTGEASMLRRVAERGERGADLGLLAPFLASAPAEADLLMAVELSAARAAGWPLPADWLDVWPEGKDAWKLIWEMPGGLGLAYDGGDLALVELALICDGHTAADRIRAALEQWTPQAKSVLASRIDRMAASVAGGEIVAADAPRYELALRGSLAALESAHVELVDRCVWIRADFGGTSAQWTAAAAGSRTAIRSDWLRAAGSLDGETHGRLHGALAKHDTERGQMPPGVLNGGILPPDTRLSWITTLLPYLGHAAWSEQLNSSYSWDSPKNSPVTTRRLAEVLNPAVEPSETESGYPVSHYAGLAGIGADAARLSREDPRAGVFGFQSSRRLGDIPDGASNTIATVGVTGGLGSWAAGGTATVRAFTQKPYINGPDGLGSGQPDGMYVGMADGSARFFSKDTDPVILEQLATAAGGETVRIAPESPKRPIAPVGADAKTAGDAAASQAADKPRAPEAAGQPDTKKPGDAAAAQAAEKPQAPEVAGQPETKKPGGAAAAQATDKPRAPEVAGQPETKKPGGAAAAQAAEKPQAPEVAGQPDTKKPEAKVAGESAGANGKPQPSPAADPAERLAAAIPGVAVTDVPLADVVEVLRRYGGFQVTFDLVAMSELGVRLDRPVTLQQSGTTVGATLDAVLASCGLAAVVRGDQVLITDPSGIGAALRTVRYSVDDLAPPGGMSVSELGSEIIRLVAPGSWQTAGGAGTLRADGPVVEITQTEAVHRQILTFCEKLRVARGLPIRSNRPPGQFQLTSRTMLAAPLLKRPVTVSFFEPTRLARIAEELARLAKAQITVNWLALAEQGKSPEVAATVTLQDAPLGEGLVRLLAPVELAYRVIDAETIEITTPAALAAQPDREFYRVGDLLEKGLTAQTLIDKVREGVGRAAWVDSGGPGAIVFDEPSRCLIVLQSQSAQAAIAKLLGGEQ